MICRSNADSNSPLVTCHMFKFSFDPYNALMDVDAILQMRKKRCREVECFTQGCTACIRAQLSQDFGINTQTLVKLKQSWGSLVPSVTNSYRRVLLFLLTDSPIPHFIRLLFLQSGPASTWGCSTRQQAKYFFATKQQDPYVACISPGVKWIEREHLKTSPSQTWICVWRLLGGKESFQIRAVVTRLCICQNS